MDTNGPKIVTEGSRGPALIVTALAVVLFLMFLFAPCGEKAHAQEKGIHLNLASITLRHSFTSGAPRSESKTELEAAVLGAPMNFGRETEVMLGANGNVRVPRGASMASVKTAPASDLEEFFRDLADDKLLLSAEDYRVALGKGGIKLANTEEMVEYLRSLEVRTIEKPVFAMLGKSVMVSDSMGRRGGERWELSNELHERNLGVGERVLYDPELQRPVLSLYCRNVIVSVDRKPAKVDLTVAKPAPADEEELDDEEGGDEPSYLKHERRPRTAGAILQDEERDRGNDELSFGLIPYRRSRNRDREESRCGGKCIGGIAAGVGVVVLAAIFKDDIEDMLRHKTVVHVNNNVVNDNRNRPQPGDNDNKKKPPPPPPDDPHPQPRP